MEREGLLEEGQEVELEEGLLPSAYYYVIKDTIAMSYNIPLNKRLKNLKGKVKSITHNDRGFYVDVYIEGEKC